MNAEERTQKFMGEMEAAVLAGNTDNFESFVSAELTQAFREYGNERLKDAVEVIAETAQKATERNKNPGPGDDLVTSAMICLMLNNFIAKIQELEEEN